MQLGSAYRVTCSAYEVLYPIKWDHMPLKGLWVCTVDISKTRYAIELPFFSCTLYIDWPNYKSSKGMLSRQHKGTKIMKMNVHSKNKRRFCIM